MIPFGGRQDSLSQIGDGPERRSPDQPLHLSKRGEGRGSLLQLATRDASADDQIQHGGAVQLALLGYEGFGLPTSPLLLVSSVQGRCRTASHTSVCTAKYSISVNTHPSHS
jgi:hypothetical protein